MRLVSSTRWLLLMLAVLVLAAPSYAGVFISVNFAPPMLPVYEQPLCPAPDLMWTPGYWAYGQDGYFWVPGAWVPAPYVGALWTPGYWGWAGGLFVWHEGYWGRHVGYYGGVNYGFGYMGIGFVGGEWGPGGFRYNTAVMRVDQRFVHSTFVNREIVEHAYVARDSRVAFNGGPGGIRHEAAPEERLAEHEQHMVHTSYQQQHEFSARNDHGAYVKNNGGQPQNLAASRPLSSETHNAPGTLHPAPPAPHYAAPNAAAAARLSAGGAPARPAPAAQGAPSAPQSRGAAQPQSRPAPAQHAAAPAQHANAPAPRAEGKEKEKR
jgi:hypothetical protein